MHIFVCVRREAKEEEQKRGLVQCEEKQKSKNKKRGLVQCHVRSAKPTKRRRHGKKEGYKENVKGIQTTGKLRDTRGLQGSCLFCPGGSVHAAMPKRKKRVKSRRREQYI